MALSDCLALCQKAFRFSDFLVMGQWKSNFLFNFVCLNSQSKMAQGNRLYVKMMATIGEHSLFVPEDKVLVGVSGGADSVALLMLLREAGLHCEAVHCNFHLRGEESDRDEKFVRDLCRKLSVRLHVSEFDTEAYARSRGISIEMAARDLRYDCFERLLADWRLDKVAVAHHRNDNVETMLLNLVRGTGLKGLTGMDYRNGHVVRPLLDTSREEIEAYLAEKGQDFVTDSTNLGTDAVRNKIRLELLPMMQGINPGVFDTLQDTLRHLSDAYILYKVAVEGLKGKAMGGNRIDIETLKALPAPRTLLFELLYGYGFNGAQVAEIYERLDGEPGKVYESDEWRLLRDRGCLWLRRKSEVYRCLCDVLPLDGFVQVAPDMDFSISRVHCVEGFDIPRGKDTACLDLDKLEYPVTVRLVQEGDRFVPFGMQGEKLVSDYLTDRKRTLFEKERQLVVCSGDAIAWLVGERPDERFRIDGRTTRVLVIQCQRHRTGIQIP